MNHGEYWIFSMISYIAMKPKIHLLIIGVVCFVVWLLIWNATKQKRVKSTIQNTIPKILHNQEIQRHRITTKQPEINEMDKLATKFAETQDPLILVSLGDMWRKGAYPRLESDNSNALKYYELAAISADKQVREIATAKYIEASLDGIPENDDAGMQLYDINFDAIVETVNEAPIIREEPIIRDDPIFLDDKQNVHDHYMNKITQRNIDKLKELHTNSQPSKENLKDALYKDDDLSIEQKALIITAIDNFNDHDEQFGCSEEESLNLTYQHILNHENRDDLLHNLFLQLHDCYENGFMVCTTGKISRVVSIIGDLDDFDHARNIYYIKDELERLAHKTREQYLNNLTQEQRDSYNLGEDDQITENIKAAYINTIKEEYCTKLGVDYAIISPHVEANMLGF